MNLWPEDPEYEGGAATGDDVEMALRSAEALQAGAGRYLRGARVITTIMTAATVVAVALASGEAAASHSIAAIVTGAALVANVVAGYVAVVRMRAEFALRQRLANDIVVMVRVVAADVAEQEGWSDVRKRTVAIRLSSFPIRPAQRQHVGSFGPGRQQHDKR
jgi:hypothetical protein